MGSDAEKEANASLNVFKKTRLERTSAEEVDQRAYLRFLRDARAADWSWYRIGAAVGLSEVAVRRYWDRNRHRADRMGRTSDVGKDQALVPSA